MGGVSHQLEADQHPSLWALEGVTAGPRAAVTPLSQSPFSAALISLRAQWGHAVLVEGLGDKRDPGMGLFWSQAGLSFLTAGACMHNGMLLLLYGPVGALVQFRWQEKPRMARTTGPGAVPPSASGSLDCRGASCCQKPSAVPRAAAVQMPSEIYSVLHPSVPEQASFLCGVWSDILSQRSLKSWSRPTSGCRDWQVGSRLEPLRGR